MAVSPFVWSEGDVFMPLRAIKGTSMLTILLMSPIGQFRCSDELKGMAITTFATAAATDVFGGDGVGNDETLFQVSSVCSNIDV